MKFLLDTNAVIAVLKGHAGLLGRLRQHARADFGLPAIVMHELRYGASKSARPGENHARLDAMRFEIVPFDADDARQAGEIRAVLGRAGTPIGGYDVLIAAQAVARSLVLVTHNIREFARVEGLRTEDWEG
ncbi:type II toxin-antitoxin system VapC family toxin [uncultured Jannaschia sp.]|uniref:type II toxin-antitoxin system VapC family toxin n=1 Tax=uncultured Jannaschia sp. TaxID=293347 RepID=UPI00261331F9|nr:type II toxin-antitoxin system VapC family toxin [uncultured Jannaschia sp.]